MTTAGRESLRGVSLPGETMRGQLTKPSVCVGWPLPRSTCTSLHLFAHIRDAVTQMKKSLRDRLERSGCKCNRTRSCKCNDTQILQMESHGILQMKSLRISQMRLLRALQMEVHRIGLQMKSLRILGLANEIAQDPANVISQRVANGGSAYLSQLSQAVIST